MKDFWKKDIVGGFGGRGEVGGVVDVKGRSGSCKRAMKRLGKKARMKRARKRRVVGSEVE